MFPKKSWRVTVVAVILSITFATFLLVFTYRDPSRLLSSCQRCTMKMEDNAWFVERFNQSVHPLMTRDNSVLSEDTFTWWKSLQSEKRPASYAAVIEQLFRLIPDQVVYMDAGPERSRICSVVGNSGNLLGSHYGPLIDASEFVIRINMGITKGFEEDVGTRTTHRVMYPESATDLDHSTWMVLIPFKIMDLQWLINALTTDTGNKVKFNKDKVLIYNPTFLKYTHDTWLEGHGYYPSTGFLTLLMTLHICDQVKVFGFGANQYGNWHHYWDKAYMAGTTRHELNHNAAHEYNVTLQLAEKRIIQMFKAEPSSHHVPDRRDKSNSSASSC